MEKGQIRRSAQTYRTDHCVLKDAKWNRTQWTRYITLDASSLQFLGLYELCRTSQVMIWCDALCDPVCISIICWHFSRCLGVFTVYKFLFVLKEKESKHFCEKILHQARCDLWGWGVPHPFSHSSPSLTFYFGQVFLSWKLDSVPPLAKTNNKTLNPKRSA